MTECEKKVLKGLISEYELKVKYNNDTRDYEIYFMLLNVQKENEELKKENEELKAIISKMETTTEKNSVAEEKKVQIEKSCANCKKYRTGNDCTEKCFVAMEKWELAE